MHAAQGATHGVGPCCRALMVFPWAGACCTGMVVVHVAAMRAAVVPVVETLDWHGGLATWVLVADVASALADAVCDAATVVAAAAAGSVLVATVVAAAAAVCVLVAITTVVSATAVAAAATIIATALLCETHPGYKFSYLMKLKHPTIKDCFAKREAVSIEGSPVKYYQTNRGVI